MSDDNTRDVLVSHSHKPTEPLSIHISGSQTLVHRPSSRRHWRSARPALYTGSDPNTNWQATLETLTTASQRGVVATLIGAHAAAAKQIVETLLDSHKPDDAEAPCSTTEMEILHAQAPDFMALISHQVRIPPFDRAGEQIRRCVELGQWVAVPDQSLAARALEDVLSNVFLGFMTHHQRLLEGLRKGPIVIIRASDDVLAEAVLASAQTNWTHSVVLIEPEVVYPNILVVEREPDPWSDDSDPNARLNAVLGRSPVSSDQRVDQPRPRFPRLIDFPPRVKDDLVARVAAGDVGPESMRLAVEIGFTRPAETWFAEWGLREFPDDNWFTTSSPKEPPDDYNFYFRGPMGIDLAGPWIITATDKQLKRFGSIDHSSDGALMEQALREVMRSRSRFLIMNEGTGLSLNSEELQAVAESVARSLSLPISS